MGNIQTVFSIGNFCCDGHTQEGTLHLSFRGDINEDVDFAVITNFIEGKKNSLVDVKMDLSNINAINSIGIRGWILFLEKIQELLPVSYECVGSTMIEQASIIPNLLGKQSTAIDFLELPYFCSTCNQRKSRRLPISQIKVGSVERIATSCKDVGCKELGGELELDILEEEFEAVLSRYK